MNFVFISPNFPPSFYHFCVELRRAGANVLTIGDAPYNEFRQELKNVITEYCRIDMTNYDKIYRTMAYFASKYGRIDRIDSHNEFWLALEAQLRGDFNIFGQKPEDILINQSKLGMKKVFHAAGVPCVESQPIANPDILGAFVRKYGFPLIIKPEIGVGASNVYKVTNEEHLAHILKGLPPGYIIEPYIEGKIVSFDGLADRNGEIMYCASFELSDNVLDLLNEQKDMFYYYSTEIDPILEKYGRRTVKGFNLRERFFHCEFFRRPDGSYTAIEINIRPPGGFSIDMLNYVADIDLFKVWAELVVCSKDVFTYKRKYNVSNVSRRDHLPYLHSSQDILKELGNIVVSYTRIPDAFSAAMGNDTFILRHKDIKTLFNAIEFVKAKKY